MMSSSIDGKQVHESGCIIAAAAAEIRIEAGGWTFTFRPGSADSVGFAEVNEGFREAMCQMALSPPADETLISAVAKSHEGLLGITVYATHRAVGSGHRLFTYTCINSNAF